MKSIVIFMVFLFLIPNMANAQTYSQYAYNPNDPLGLLFAHRCTADDCRVVTNQIENGAFNGRGQDGVSSHNRAAIDECLLSDRQVGNVVSRTWHFIDLHDQQLNVVSGTLSHDDAIRMRNQLYSETHEIRTQIQLIAYKGDVAACHALRDSAINIIRNIIHEEN